MKNILRIVRVFRYKNKTKVASEPALRACGYSCVWGWLFRDTCTCAKAEVCVMVSLLRCSLSESKQSITLETYS